MIWNTNRITLLKVTSYLRTVKTEANIRKVKHQYDQLRVLLCRKIASDLRISPTSAQRILIDNPALQPYMKQVEPNISEVQKTKKFEICKSDANETFVKRTL